MDDRHWQWVVGLFLIALGAGAAIAVWLAPFFADPLVRQIVAALAALAVLGAAMLVLPSPRAEREKRGEDLWDLSGMRMITARWWLVIVVALAVGGGHFTLVGHETGTMAFSAQTAKK
jgi:MFS family permease